MEAHLYRCDEKKHPISHYDERLSQNNDFEILSHYFVKPSHYFEIVSHYWQKWASICIQFTML